MEVVIDAELFASRLKRLHSAFTSNKDAWNGADVLCIPMGASSEEELNYSKSSALHLYLLGYEFSDSILVLTKNTVCFMATAKKCGLIEAAIQTKPVEGLKFEFFKKTKDEGMNKEAFNAILSIIRKSGCTKVGTLLKGDFPGTFIPAWREALIDSTIPTGEIAPALGAMFSVKDAEELDLCKRAAVLTNKVMKHGFVAQMEEILDKDTKVTHEELAHNMEGIIYDPTKIDLKIAKDAVDICYTPIIQSGGVYDIRVSAVCNTDYLTSDVIICSLGARYKNYCGNIARTFMVDPCPKIENTYALLLGLYDACLAKCVPGNLYKSVHEEAIAFLNKKDPTLVPHLPKNFGFATGLEFRDGSMVLNATNQNVFKAGTVLNLSVGLHNVALAASDTEKSPEAIKKLTAFSMLLADIIAIKDDGPADILTKCSKDFTNVSYNLADDDEEEQTGTFANEEGLRRSARGLEERLANESSAMARAQKQKELMEKRTREAREKFENGANGNKVDEEADGAEAVELQTYKSASDYPRDTLSNQIKVDLEKEAMIVPIGGISVPFHISTIKNVIMPEPDRATYLRINFYTSGGSLGKEVNPNLAKLVAKYGPQAAFIKELTYRSIDGRNLLAAFRLFQELRKRVRQREQKAEQEKDLVVQAKLIRIKDQRVPRLQDLTMRPTISGRKSIGNLEAHQNGLRYLSTKGEVLDVMYNNIKHAFYQPCENSLMVLIHFHLRDPIMIGKKKCKDVQFITEVVDSSLNLDGARRSAYDPDELDDEQREREMRKRLNAAFKDFCKKVERVARHYEFNVEFDIPYADMGFYGNCHREMVFLQPSVYCLVNLTELPNFVVTLSDVEHVHFERVSRATKNFDMTLIFKNWDIVPRTIVAIELKYFDRIQDWLNDVDITYTEGGLSMNWANVMKEVKLDDRFYLDTDHEGEKKPAGWSWLNANADSDEEEEEDDESVYSEEDISSSEEEESDDDSDFDEEESSEEEDGDDELEEEGKSWDELEKEAIVEDKQKRAREMNGGEDADEERRKRAKMSGQQMMKRR